MTQFLKPTALAVATLAVLAIASPAPAQQATPTPMKPMPGMAMPMPSGGGGTPAEASMMAAMDKMSKDMAAAPMTGDADRDFVAMMIPHHQGAIDMARFELANGKDPALRKLAQDVVAAQEKEITEMKGWQAQQSGPR